MRAHTVEGMRPAARKIARAFIKSSNEQAKRRGPGRYRATVVRFTSVSNFVLDVHGEDLELDELDVTLTAEVLRTHDDDPIVKDDIMVLVEIDELDFSAVAVERS